MSDRNFTNRTIWCGDNLVIMQCMNSESVDLIATDPPFNSNADYSAPIGSEAAGTHFKDRWNLDDIKVEWIDMLRAKHPALWGLIQCCQRNSDKAYLVYMIPRLLEMHRLLKPTGSLYLHVDPTMGAYLKLCLDIIFGRANFRNEIVWCYTGPGSPGMRQFNRKHDNIYWYAKGKSWVFNRDDVRMPYKDPKQRPRKAYDTGGAFDPAAIAEMRKRGKIPETWWTDIAVAVRGKENTKFKTQKPLKLYRRIIAASCPPDGIVFDPFGGCATTAVAAEQLDREWVTCDLSPKTAELIVRQMELVGVLGFQPSVTTVGPQFQLQRTDMEEYPPYRTQKPVLHAEQRRECGECTDKQGHCEGCERHLDLDLLEVDHIAIRRGMPGADNPDNLQLLCATCNRKKGNRGMEYLMKALRLNHNKFKKV